VALGWVPDGEKYTSLNAHSYLYKEILIDKVISSPHVMIPGFRRSSITALDSKILSLKISD